MDALLAHHVRSWEDADEVLTINGQTICYNPETGDAKRLSAYIPNR